MITNIEVAQENSAFITKYSNVFSKLMQDAKKENLETDMDNMLYDEATNTLNYIAILVAYYNYADFSLKDETLKSKCSSLLSSKLSESNFIESHFDNIISEGFIQNIIISMGSRDALETLYTKIEDAKANNSIDEGIYGNIKNKLDEKGITINNSHTTGTPTPLSSGLSNGSGSNSDAGSNSGSGSSNGTGSNGGNGNNNPSAQSSGNGQPSDPTFDFDNMSFDELLDALTPAQIESGYVHASDKKVKDKYESLIKHATYKNAINAVDDFSETYPDVKNKFNPFIINQKVKKLDLDTEEKRIIINFVIDEKAGQKTSPVLNMPQDKFRKLRKGIRRFVNWVETKNIKLVPRQEIDEDGREVTVVKVKHGNFYNLVAAASDFTKNVINKTSKKVSTSERCQKIAPGKIKEAIKIHSQKRELRKKIRKEKFKEKVVAPFAKKLGDWAGNISNTAHDGSTSVAEDSRNARQVYESKLKDLKRKKGTARSGNPVTLDDVPELESAPHI